MNVVSLSANGVEPVSLVRMNHLHLTEEDKSMLGRGDGTDTGFLVLCPVFQDHVYYTVHGNARLIASGFDLDSISCPVIHVTGPCSIVWSDSCDGDQLVMEAACDGRYWIVRPVNSDRIEPFYYGV
jgi:hypothetical protein